MPSENDDAAGDGPTATDDDKKTAAAPPTESRTPLEILRDDGGAGSQKERDKLRRRNSGKGAAWTSSVHIPTSDIPLNSKSRNISRQASNILAGQTADPDISAVPDSISPAISAADKPAKRLVRETNLDEEDDDDDDDEENDNDGDGEYSPAAASGQQAAEPVRMSLMSLLAETDEQLGSGGLAYMMEDDDEDDDDDGDGEDDGGGGEGAEYNSCCVCMVKHKGAAFSPCGHSFCRLCSREMWVERGNCPLCNNYILEILDVF
ncbi:uncharacterized protein LOC127245346 [Andrographis paniculata]|uniref:uncharacterized protein LOC127245346 n=1 Tax=Andrographis paniculata TaxID=175694 RepID=UPI0021E89E68|nr:uncharacterized protein LOC127245346 [Andrographis paniculata]